MSITSINPATGTVIAEYDAFTAEQIEQAIAETHAAFASWRETGFAERSVLMRRAAAVLRERKGAYGALMTAEMGKTIAEAEAEVEKCAWNCPFWQVFRFAAPALMAGNTCLLKHASNVTGSALAIEAVFRDAGFPRGCFRTLIVPGSGVEAIIEDARVRAVTL